MHAHKEWLFEQLIKVKIKQYVCIYIYITNK